MCIKEEGSPKSGRLKFWVRDWRVSCPQTRSVGSRSRARDKTSLGRSSEDGGDGINKVEEQGREKKNSSGPLGQGQRRCAGVDRAKREEEEAGRSIQVFPSEMMNGVTEGKVTATPNNVNGDPRRVLV